MVTRGKTGQTPKLTATVQPTEYDKAYAAGITEADGHVALHRLTRRPPSQRLASVKYQAEIVITNTDYRLIQWLMERFGGRPALRKKTQAHHKDTWQWKATDRTAWQFAEMVLPYMLIKKAQAEIIIEFYEKRIEHKRGKGATLLPEEAARRADLYARLRALVDDRRPQRLNETAPDLIG